MDLMKENIKNINIYYFIYYFVVINLFSIFITVFDKLASKYRKNDRIREKTLFIVAIIGGSLFMLISMKLIKHKTKHKSFMLGLPIIILIQLILLITIFMI